VGLALKQKFDSKISAIQGKYSFEVLTLTALLTFDF
jgi:hypothetical protein